MTTLDYTQVDAQVAENVINELQVLLADFQVFYTNLRGFHWNVKGTNFKQLHEQYEEMYDDVADKVDEVAERILMLGGTPAHKFSDYLKVTNIKETGVVNCGKEIGGIILDNIKTLIAQERKILDLSGEGDDEATNAMMSDYISEQEKTVWFFVSALS